MTNTPTSKERELRNIDQVGYENYRYLLDLIYNAGGLHKDHYKLKDRVDQYIVNLLAARERQLLEELEAEGPKMSHTWDFEGLGSGVERIAAANGFNDANAKWRTLIQQKKGKLHE